MYQTPDTKDDVSSRQSEGNANDHQKELGRRRRRPWRIVLITLGSLLTLVIVAVIGSYAYVNHVVSSIPRLHVAGLTASTSSSLDGQTFLITSEPWGPTGDATQAAAIAAEANIVMLLHTNANGRGGGAVSLPGYVMVDVPGTGTEQLWDALTTGGPSLLVQTVTQVTQIHINHYARLDLNHIDGLVNAIGGVDITLPFATEGFGYHFVKGVNHLNGLTAIYYARDPSVSAEDRLLRQENLVRAVMTKIANDHLLTNPVTMVHVMNAITSLLAVDSNFSNADIESLVRQFGKLSADASTFVTAPTRTVRGSVALNTTIDDQLWTAVKHSSIAAFAKKYPWTVVPHAAP